MKKFVLLCAVTVAMAVATGKAVASSSGAYTVTMSGTVELVKTNYFVKSTNDVQTTETKSFNNATIYLAISNAVANIKKNDPAAGLTPTNLPAKGLIVYAPGFNDGMVTGAFFVTTKGSTNFFYPLSGTDTNGNYYSYAELDTTTNAANENAPLGFDLGPANGAPDDFNEVSSFNSTSQKGASTAILYVHDNPYAYDVADFWAWFNSTPGIAGLNSPNPGNNFQFSLAIQGILTISSNNKTGSATFSGTSGNALVSGKQSLVLSGKATIN